MPSSSNDVVIRINPPRFELLEQRTLFAGGFGSGDGGDAVSNALPAQFGGSMLFARGNGGGGSSGGGFGVGILLLAHHASLSAG